MSGHNRGSWFPFACTSADRRASCRSRCGPRCRFRREQRIYVESTIVLGRFSVSQGGGVMRPAKGSEVAQRRGCALLFSQRRKGNRRRPWRRDATPSRGSKEKQKVRRRGQGHCFRSLCAGKHRLAVELMLAVESLYERSRESIL